MVERNVVLLGNSVPELQAAVSGGLARWSWSLETRGRWGCTGC